MRTGSFFITLCFCVTIFVFANCKNNTEDVLTLKTITERGINFADVVKNAQLKDGAVSQECKDQLIALLKEPDALLRMADAWSKFPYPGAFYIASRSDWANYDECIRVDVTNSDVRVLGKFCAWGFILPDLTGGEAWKLSSCVPDKCSPNDLQKLVGLPDALPLFNNMSCSTKETDSELDTGAIVTIVIVGTIIFLMIVSTIYDVYLYFTKKKSAHILFTAFSIYTNGQKLLAVTKHSKEQVLCFNGLKFISMAWIVSGHGIIGWYLAPLLEEETRTAWPNKRVSQYTTTSHISVDTFFYISGFLMSYLYFKSEASKKPLMTQLKTIPMMIVHRYLRLTPANGMCFLVSVYLLRYFNNGPMYSVGINKGISEVCEKYWWSFFLYFQNYYNFHKGESLCIPTTWYLSADMQLFLVAPLVIMPISILYRRSFKKALAALFGVNILFFVIPIFTRLQWRDYDPDFKEYDFHGKLISYFIGIMMGIYLRHEKNKPFVISRRLNLLLWFLALGMMHSVMWYRSEVQIYYGYVAKSICYSITRPMWCISLCWITYACFFGYGGIINWFLSSSFMQIGAKLVYCIYIVHGLVIANYALGVKYRFVFNDWQAFYISCGHFIVSILIATFWSLAFELPMISIEKVIFGQGKRAPKPSTARADQQGHDNPQKVT